jgi:hypothetical protein
MPARQVYIRNATKVVRWDKKTGDFIALAYGPARFSSLNKVIYRF